MERKSCCASTKMNLHLCVVLQNIGVTGQSHGGLDVARGSDSHLRDMVSPLPSPAPTAPSHFLRASPGTRHMASPLLPAHSKMRQCFTGTTRLALFSDMTIPFIALQRGGIFDPCTHTEAGASDYVFEHIMSPCSTIFLRKVGML